MLPLVKAGGRGQADPVAMPGHAGLRPLQLISAARLDAIETYYYDHRSVLIGRRSRYTHLALPYDRDFQSPARYGHGPYICNRSKSKVSWLTRHEWKQMDRRTRPTAVPSLLTRSVGYSHCYDGLLV